MDDWAPNEPLTRPWEPLRLVDSGKDKLGAWEDWENLWYQVRKRSHVLLISHADGSARHDWREFQRIKSELWGAEAEAVEVYPAESRVNDPSNGFFLWRHKGRPIGIKGVRNVLPPGCAPGGAPQRSLCVRGDDV